MAVKRPTLPRPAPVKAKARHGRIIKPKRKLPSHPPAQGLLPAGDLQLFVQNGGQLEPLPKEILKELEGISLDRTIEAGSTVALKVLDPHRNLQHRGYFERATQSRADFFLDDLWFRCAHFAKAADEFTLTAEDREIAMMRAFVGPASSSAAQGRRNPRAVWIEKLCRAAGLHMPQQFFCPEIGKKPPVLAAVETAAQKKKAKARGGAKKAMLKGVKLDPDQQHNLETIMSVCDAKNVSATVRIAIVCAALTEGELKTHNPANDGTGSDGVFQTRSSWDSKMSKYDTKKVAEYWLEQGFFSGAHGGGGGIKLGAQGLPPGVIAQEVEGSAFPERYETHRHEAEELIKVAGGSTGEPKGSGAAEGSTYTPQRTFKLPMNERSQGEQEGEEGEQEGAWENSETYAQEVAWRLFCVAGVVHYLSDEYLEQMVPWIEGLDETMPGVVDVKWAIDSRAKVNPPNLELDVRCPIWSPPPGVPIVMGDRNGKELHEGIWIVSTIHRPDLFDNAATITLTRPRAAKAERALAAVARPISSVTPGAPTGEVTRDGGHNAGPAQPMVPGGGGSPAAIPETAWRVYFNAQYIDKQHLPYVYGGGHGATFGPTGSTIEQLFGKGAHEGLDCSGAVSYALGGGGTGILSHPYDTVGLEFWGVPGTGKYFTVWVRSVPDGHTFLEFTGATTGGKPRWFVAQQTGTIVGFKPENQKDTGNWKPRHWRGL